METSCEQWALERQPEGLRRTRKMGSAFPGFPIMMQTLGVCVETTVRETGRGVKYIFVKHQQSGNKAKSSRLPSLQFLLSMFSRNRWRKFGQKSFPTSSID